MADKDKGIEINGKRIPKPLLYDYIFVALRIV